MVCAAGEQGMLQVDILEKYGIASETELSEIEQDYFSKLEFQGLNPLHSKKVKMCCEAVGARPEEMLHTTVIGTSNWKMNYLSHRLIFELMTYSGMKVQWIPAIKKQRFFVSLSFLSSFLAFWAGGSVS